MSQFIPEKQIRTLRRNLGKLCFLLSAPVLNYLVFIKRPHLPNFAHKFQRHIKSEQ
jgi:hypothetical protein